CDDHCWPATNQTGRQCRKSIKPAVCPVIVNRYVAPLMQAGLGETLAERLQAAGKNLWRGNPEIADHRHRRLLPACRERPCCRAAEQRDELAPSHSITSSCFGVGMTGLVNEQNIRTLQRIENRACNDPGILTTDMKPISCGFPSMRVMCLEYSIRN